MVKWLGLGVTVRVRVRPEDREWIISFLFFFKVTSNFVLSFSWPGWAGLGHGKAVRGRSLTSGPYLVSIIARSSQNNMHGASEIKGLIYLRRAPAFSVNKCADDQQ